MKKIIEIVIGIILIMMVEGILGGEVEGAGGIGGWKVNNEPRINWTPVVTPNLPVVGVDWCDAEGYCKGIGKRLCGRVGGGMNGYEEWRNVSSEWYNICSIGGSRKYVYGDVYESGRCNDGVGVVEVGSKGSCVGYGGIKDMSGNVGEWENSCEGNDRWSYCHVRGGSWNLVGGWLGCGGGKYGMNRDQVDEGVGIRCCY